MYKKGELTTQQIVILIILIASFAVILFFFLRLNLGQQTSQQICHNSVITRGSSIVSADAFPLKCQRQYVCLSFDGTCEKMTKPDVIKVKTKDDVYKALADQMAECWWMFGEGKVDYVGSGWSSDLYCSLCSQIAFDDSVNKDIFKNAGSFDKKNIYIYMKNNKYSNGQTYLYYLFKTNNLNQISRGDFGKVNLDKEYYSLLGIKSTTSTWAFLGIGAGTIILSFTPLEIPGALIAGGIAFATTGTGQSLLAPVVHGSSGNDFIAPSLIQVNSPEFDALKCEEIKTSS